MYGGRRKSEICRFKVSDFDDNHLVFGGAMYKSSPILTKGNKYLECYTLAKRFKPYLDMWIDYRTENGIVSEWLFPAKDDPKRTYSDYNPQQLDENIFKYHQQRLLLS